MKPPMRQMKKSRVYRPGLSQGERKINEPLTSFAASNQNPDVVALADGEKHGYAILKEVEQQTEGEVRLSTGTLYGIIKRLLADGMIQPTTWSMRVPPMPTTKLSRPRRSVAGFPPATPIITSNRWIR